MRYVYLVLTTVVAIGAVIACSNHANVQCETNTNCDLTTGGVCAADTVGGHWCAYPDSGCPNGYRYSNQDVGDGISGQCLAVTTDAGQPGQPPTSSASHWLSQLHATTSAGLSGARILSNNDVVIAGTFSGKIEIGASSLSASISDGFAARLRAADGTPVWVKQFTSSNGLNLLSLDVDASDDVFVSGNYIGTAIFNSTSYPSAGMNDVFITKISGADGSYLWAHAFGAATNDLASGMAVDRFGDVAFAGFFSGTISPGSGSLTGSNAAFIVKYTGLTGTQVWAKAIVSTDTQEGDFIQDLTVDESGNVVALGVFAGAVDFGGGSINTGGIDQGFLVKYAKENGAYIFESRLPTTSNILASDASGNIYIGGTFANTLALASPPLTSAGNTDVFVVKYSAEGTPQWERGFGNELADAATALRIDSSGQILLSAVFQGTVSYGGANFTAANEVGDVIVAHLSSEDGSHLGSIHLGGMRAPALDSKVSVFIGGQFGGTAAFGDQMLTAAGTSDGFALVTAPF